MSSEELSLTWGDHHSTLVGVFEKLLVTNTLVDCTIAAEGQYLRAHKVVLSACSPYFELLFAQENEKNPIVILKDIKFQELKSMIDFIYRGKVKIPEDRLEDFIDAAESLQIKGLGGGQKAEGSGRKGNELSLTQKRGGLTSHAPRKRRRLSTEDTESKSSPKSDLNSESNSCESLPVSQEPTDVLGLSQPEIPSPIVTLTTGSDVISPDVHIEPSDSETNPPTMPVECTLPPRDSERLLEHAASVVKREPEPIAEIFLDDNDCFVDPKKEVCMEEMGDLESDGISAVMEYVQQQQTTNQYSGSSVYRFVSPPENSSTDKPKFEWEPCMVGKLLEEVRKKYDKLNERKGKRKNLWVDIATEIGEEEVTWIRAQQKWKNLVKNYQNYIKFQNATGGGKRKPPPFYEEIHNILGERHAIYPPLVLDSEGDMPVAINPICEESSPEHSDNDDNEEPVPGCSSGGPSPSSSVKKRMGPKTDMMSVVKEMREQDLKKGAQKLSDNEELVPGCSSSGPSPSSTVKKRMGPKTVMASVLKEMRAQDLKKGVQNLSDKVKPVPGCSSGPSPFSSVKKRMSPKTVMASVLKEMREQDLKEGAKRLKVIQDIDTR